MPLRNETELLAASWEEQRATVSPPTTASQARNTACIGQIDALSKQRKCFLLIKFCLGHAYPNGASVTFTGRLREESYEIRDQHSQPPRRHGSGSSIDARRRHAFGAGFGGGRDHS